MDAPPAIVTTQGTTEDWTIENRSAENHEFHIHQIHFLLMGRNGKKVSREEKQMLDTSGHSILERTGPIPVSRCGWISADQTWAISCIIATSSTTRTGA